ncbi:exopolysaccharide biosynthesis polyprenyl glycosylphosphotransferase [Nocardioides hwasunensis]|uniref:Exopolysaccharide biosynthesis polyprenyl glycosylphosphotransferase n=1 Tax=Nocardioides hwasunensis TaxID=397258 RepID=A0ABR8MGX1_9ACTN|nr:exopolysaccharide biosynthesis polyprenyl glycosylphosphotransferase [Nocardioides hwasunensis]MBD3915218.1 exopolysaccharide biosynthesis polyprenyl glycosylphosphotransferase [Nocardioides hwasunensis]
MTQVVARGMAEVIAPDSTLLRTPVPHPRGARHSAPLLPPAPPLVPPVEAAPVAAVPFTPLPSPARPTWPFVAIDLALALALSGTAVIMELVPLALACVAAAGWPLLLLVAGRYAPPSLGQGRLARPGLVLRTGGRAAIVALAVSTGMMTTHLIGLAALLGALAVASAVPALVGVRRRGLRLVLAGRPRDVRDALAALSPDMGHEVVAACLTRTSKEPMGELPTYVGFEGSPAVAHHHRADALVVLPGARLEPAEVRRLHWSLEGVGTELYLGTGLLDVEPQRTRVVSSAGLDVLHVTHPVLDGPRRLLKDVIERSVALVAFVLALPLLAVLCVAIRRETPGPALFRQQRIGRDGVPFTMLKLRSMGVEAEDEKSGLVAHNEGDGILFKIKLDPRITRLGAKLRRYSLDELPQLWNVVRGDMSLVGPRPALPSEVARYDVDPRRRLVVKPGVTGLWQVSGRSDLTWAQSVRLDLRYVDNWSLRLDLAILARTVRAVLGHRGAY